MKEMLELRKDDSRAQSGVPGSYNTALNTISTSLTSVTRSVKKEYSVSHSFPCAPWMWFLLIIQPIIFLLLGVTTLCLGAKSSKPFPPTLEEVIVIPNVSPRSTLSETYPSLNEDISTLSETLSTYSDPESDDTIIGSNPPPQNNVEGDSKIEEDIDSDETLTYNSDLDSHCDSDSDFDSDSELELDSSSEGSACILDDDELSDVYLDNYDRMVVQVAPTADCTNYDDSGLEAKARRCEMRSYDWRPYWRLGEVVTAKTHEVFFMNKGDPVCPKERQKIMTPAERKKEQDMLREYYRDKHVRFSNCLYEAHVVYGFDEVRGDGDFDEDTMDDMDLINREMLEAEIDAYITGAKKFGEKKDDTDSEEEPNVKVAQRGQRGDPLFEKFKQNYLDFDHDDTYSESLVNDETQLEDNKKKDKKKKKKWRKKEFIKEVEKQRDCMDNGKERLGKLQMTLERAKEKCLKLNIKDRLLERLMELDKMLERGENFNGEPKTARDPSLKYKFKVQVEDETKTNQQKPKPKPQKAPVKPGKK